MSTQLDSSHPSPSRALVPLPFLSLREQSTGRLPSTHPYPGSPASGRERSRERSALQRPLNLPPSPRRARSLARPRLNLAISISIAHLPIPIACLPDHPFTASAPTELAVAVLNGRVRIRGPRTAWRGRSRWHSWHCPCSRATCGQSPGLPCIRRPPRKCRQLGPSSKERSDRGWTLRSCCGSDGRRYRRSGRAG